MIGRALGCTLWAGRLLAVPGCQVRSLARLFGWAWSLAELPAWACHRLFSAVWWGCRLGFVAWVVLRLCRVTVQAPWLCRASGYAQHLGRAVGLTSCPSGAVGRDLWLPMHDRSLCSATEQSCNFDSLLRFCGFWQYWIDMHTLKNLTMVNTGSGNVIQPFQLKSKLKYKLILIIEILDPDPHSN